MEMKEDAAQDALDRIVVASGRLQNLLTDLQQQARETQAAMRTTREQEEIKFKTAMVAQFQDQQQRMEAALHPRIAWAWKINAAMAGFAVLLFAGYWLLLSQANERLRTAQARVDAIETTAEVLEASRHVEITSCAGRPCIRIDKGAPTWSSRGKDYVLVDGKPGK